MLKSPTIILLCNRQKCLYCIIVESKSIALKITTRLFEFSVIKNFMIISNIVKTFFNLVSPKLKCPLSAKLKCPLHREAGNGDNQHEHEGNQSFGSDAKVGREKTEAERSQCYSGSECQTNQSVVEVLSK